MERQSPYWTDPHEPLGLVLREAEAPARLADVACRRFEFSSRGDRVPGRLLLPPDAREPAPLVLLQHGALASKEADYIDATAGPWVRGGAAVATIDFPLHGERADAKLSQRLAADLAAAGAPAGAAPVLWSEFVRQAVLDLRRALDALARVPEVDAGRSVYAAFSLGSIVGAVFCGCDPRPRAAALALGGGGFGPEAADPARHIGRFAPRPVLFVNTREDRTVRREFSEVLHAAAGEPKQVEWYPGGHREVPGRALKSMWLFLRPHLGLA